MKPKKKLKKIILPKGRWCRYFEGRMPTGHDCEEYRRPGHLAHPHCKLCTRNITIEEWERGDWDDIADDIRFGRKDFTRKNGKLGRWCEYYEGRVPYPIECQYNKVIPLCNRCPNCMKCERSPDIESWRAGEWLEIIRKVDEGHDFTKKKKFKRKKIKKK